MSDLATIRERYLQDSPCVRLGGLAANLARIASFSNNEEHKGPVRDLIVERVTTRSEAEDRRFLHGTLYRFDEPFGRTAPSEDGSGWR